MIYSNNYSISDRRNKKSSLRIYDAIRNEAWKHALLYVNFIVLLEWELESMLGINIQLNVE